MKKKTFLSAALAMMLCLNLCAGPARAETEPTETGALSTIETVPPMEHHSGDASIHSGCHSIDGQVPLMGLTEFAVKANAAMLYEVDTQTVLYGYQMDQKLYPASLTKVVTCIVALDLCREQNVSLDQVITCPKAVINQVDPYGSDMALVSDEELSIDQLLYGLMVKSANDAGMVLADFLCGSEEAFVAKMNEKVAELGCRQTNYKNVHGLHDEEHYTTARDMARILAYAIEDEDFYRYFTTEEIIVPATNKSAERRLVSTNYMMSRDFTEVYYDTRVVGGKTGFTTPAGRCLVTLSESGGMRMISVIMGAQMEYSADGRTIVSYGNFDETKKMIDLAYAKFMPTQVLSPNQTLGQFAVAYSTAATQGVVQGTVDTVVPVGSDLSSIRYEYIMDEGALTAPLDAGTSIGIVRVWYETKCLAQQELYAASFVEKDVPTVHPSDGTDPASPVPGGSTIGNMVLIAVLVLVGLIAAGMVAAYVRVALIRAKRARRRKNQRRSR